MFHSIIIEQFLKDRTVLDKYKIINQKIYENWKMHIVEVHNHLPFITDIQESMIEIIPCYFHLYDEGKNLLVVFKDLICDLDPNDQIIWQEAADYLSNILKISCWQFQSYPKKISDEPIWLNI